MTRDNHELEPEPHFYTLIVDIWGEQVQSSNALSWHFRVRDVRTGEHRVFTTLDEFLDHLNDQFGELSDHG